jgi:N-acetyl-anhydromuramoyl-L-alanine amidase
MNSSSIYPNAIWRASPNCNKRPTEQTINLIVIHNISLPPDYFGGPFIDDLFMNRLDANAHPYFKAINSAEVSAHCLITREGTVIQYVDFNQRAWHAGQSSWQGRENCNDFSIGIELEGCDTHPFDERQYQALNSVISFLKQSFPTIEAVCGHSDIAPNRKTDPGPLFDWHRLGDK